jgi:hypothetical protein
MRRAMPVPDPIEARLAALEALGAHLQQAVAALQAGRGRGPRDGADVELLGQIATSTQRLPFTARQLFDHAGGDARLSCALDAADIDNPKQLGKLLARCADRDRGDVCVRRVRLISGTSRWAVSWVSSNDTNVAADSYL